jgi:DNA-binding response OmpR family regulator
MRVLLVEDADSESRALASALGRRGLVVHWLWDHSAVRHWVSDIDAVVVHNCSGGVALCRQVRALSDVAILMVSSRGAVSRRIEGLRAGADDYLVEPCSVDELVARLHAVRRRQLAGAAAATTAEGAFRLADVLVDFDRRQVSIGDRSIRLTQKEYLLLALLVAARGKVCTRERILAEVWGGKGRAGTRTMDVHLNTLRAKLGRRDLIENVRGVGYRISEDVVAAADSLPLAG